MCYCDGVPQCWGMPVVHKQNKRRERLVPSSIALLTRDLFGSFTISWGLGPVVCVLKFSLSHLFLQSDACPRVQVPMRSPRWAVKCYRTARAKDKNIKYSPKISLSVRVFFYLLAYVHLKTKNKSQLCIVSVGFWARLYYRVHWCCLPLRYGKIYVC